MSSDDNLRKVLAAGKVYGSSLPRSLRHYSPDDALEEAKAIAHFLSHTADAFSDYKSEVDA